MRSFVFAILLAGLTACAGGSSGRSATVVPALEKTTSAYRYAAVFSFLGYDGADPEGTLTDFNGKLYGTTAGGGYYSQGTVFSLTTSGKETVLHNFGQAGDGDEPEAGLTALNGTFYGTTYSGGTHGKGTVFSITPAGKERVLYSFGSQARDGTNPLANLIVLNGVLYGTTPYGGVSAGTAFKITTAGAEKVLFFFPANSKKNGDTPYGPLVAYNGKLYGTTETSGPCLEGTVFSLTPSGQERTLYGFPCQRYDGANPKAGLTVVNGVLYGVTTWGGEGTYDDGTVFGVSGTGKVQVIFDFVPESKYGNGANTQLVLINGTLYGTTPTGAANGKGSIYGVTPSGQATLLHTFGVAPDGSAPLGGLTNVRGTLYGTTSTGGGIANAGMVFRITP